MASSAKTEQWSFWGGSPSSASATAALVRVRASSMVLPFTSSVAMELVATAAPQPKVLNFTSTMTPSSMRMVIFIISPHF